MNANDTLREPSEKMIAAVDAAIHDNWPSAREMAIAVYRAVTAALPTDAVQPVGGVDREAIARVIDPASFSSIGDTTLRESFGTGNQCREIAYAKADAILASYATPAQPDTGAVEALRSGGCDGCGVKAWRLHNPDCPVMNAALSTANTQGGAG